MKKLVMMAVLLTMCSIVYAQGTLRTIIFADSSDDRI